MARGRRPAAAGARRGAAARDPRQGGAGAAPGAAGLSPARAAGRRGATGAGDGIIRAISTASDIDRENGAIGVIVLGTSRSGTSAVTRAFLHSGYFAGLEEERLGASSSNQAGHYELLSVLALDEELLAEFGGRWWADVPDRDEQARRRDELLPRVRSLLEAIVAKGEGAPVVIKDPRINGLLPLWQPLLEDALHPVLAVRDPLAIALSLATRDGTPIAHGLAAWEAHTTLVLDWLDGRTVTIAPYAELLREPELAGEIVDSATSHLTAGFAASIDPSKAPGALKPDLRHEVADDLVHGEYLTEYQTQLWDYLRGLPAGDVTPAVPAEFRRSTQAALTAVHREGERIETLLERNRLADEFRELSGRAGECAAELAETRSDLARVNDELAETRSRLTETEGLLAATELRHLGEIAAIEGSTSWRITAPLRSAKRLLGSEDSQGPDDGD